MTENAGSVSEPYNPNDPNRWSEYEIEATTSLTDRVLRNLKYGDAFAVIDAHGDFGTSADTAEGIFYRDTRYLSHFEMRLEGKRPLLLSSAVHEDKAALSVELTNPDLTLSGEHRLPRDTIFLHRTKFLWQAVCYERISVKNFTAQPQRLRIDFLYDADFRDLFEVRGTSRLRRGKVEPEIIGGRSIVFRYTGLDRIIRCATLHFDPDPSRIEVNRTTIEVELAPYAQKSLFVTVAFDEQGITSPSPRNFLFAYRETRRARRASTASIATVTSSNQSFDDVVCRATSDAYTLVTRGSLGHYPYAGIPWFNTVFGRDGIITAILMLWVDPQIARGVLQTLAATQAIAVDPASDAQPGKILHEMRHGEMARLHEVPFGRYYGTVDATPLFVMLAGMYLERTGDLKTVREIWPNISAALQWIDGYGDLDGDGFVEYARARESGLANQGWKDSHDAVFHDDGTGAVGAIALCEVQGYVFAAKRHAAKIAALMGNAELASVLIGQAERLRQKFEAMFWCEDIGTYALALDGSKRPCKVLASNAGHALFTGIALPERARSIARNLLGPAAFSGWGIRTLAVDQPRYNPMSYHNGSVWPHDNALIAIGFANYGLKSEAARVLTAMVDAATYQDLSRLPELFCGFARRPGRPPVPYPVACAPQAWAAASIFGLLGCCLGLQMAYQEDEIRFCEPVMPDFLDEIVLRNLRLGTSSMDIRLHRYGNDVTANVLGRSGETRLVILK
jgi:glycogen debranching enzyme